VLSAQARERDVGGHSLVMPHTTTRYPRPRTVDPNCSQIAPN
jgi:hypothetical protein